MFTVTILCTLHILAVNCNLKIIDPVFPEYSNIDFNRTRMLSSASPYLIEEVCTPKKAWLLTRHGTKYPSLDVLNNIEEKLVPKIQMLLSRIYATESDFDNLDKRQKRVIKKIIKWKNVTLGGTHKDLNEEGKLLMKNLGKRWNHRLKEFTKHLKADEIEAFSSEEDRCVVSGRKFLSEFFEGDYDEIVVKRVPEDDIKLRLVKPAKHHVKVPDPLNPKTLMNVEDLYFRNNSSRMIKKIQKILFPEHEEHWALVTGEMVQIMFDACAHSFYHLNEDGTKADAWCHLFEFEDLKIFEEMNDLKYYYQNGYHLETNVKMGNAIMNDLLQFITDSKILKFKLFIGHTSNILSVITRFGLFKDKNKLTIDNIQDMKDRKWKSSFMTPLGCNIMVVVYDCGFETLRISFYLNETPIEMVMNNGVTCIKCPIEDFVEKLIRFETNIELLHSKSTKESNIQRKKEKAERLQQQMKEKELKKIELANKQEE